MRGAELTHHLEYARGDPAGRGSGNSRDGTTSKTLLTEHDTAMLRTGHRRDVRPWHDWFYRVWL